MPRDKAVELCRDLGQTLKVEHLGDGLAGQATVSFYRQGEFLDLCRGPHVPTAGAIGAFKLLSVAGAYWKGDASRQQLQRLYGTAWFTRRDLEEHLKQLEEAKRRDHRVLGKQLELFAIDPMVGSGLVLWLPKGATIRHELENFLYAELMQSGYQPVNTPNIARVELYEISGHYPYYAESQFPPIEMADGERYLLKPMNCPHHIMIYQSKPRSYRDLPLRLAEFGTVYRFEQSGELNGMTRVRGFTQDDAHIFCTEEQVAGRVPRLHRDDPVRAEDAGAGRLPRAARVPRSDERQIRGQRRDVAAGRGGARGGLPRDGPAQFRRRSRARRRFTARRPISSWPTASAAQWQLGTVQLDYNLPSAERFDLEYIGADNQPHRPVMIHRAPFGSLERFTGMLIEHFAGAFPLWLAPEQVRVLGVSQKFEYYAREVERAAGRGRPAGLGRLPPGEDRGQDPRRPVGADPLHVRGRRAGDGAADRGRPRPDRRRPRLHAPGDGHREAQGGDPAEEGAGRGKRRRLRDEGRGMNALGS